MRPAFYDSVVAKYHIRQGDYYPREEMLRVRDLFLEELKAAITPGFVLPLPTQSRRPEPGDIIGIDVGLNTEKKGIFIEEDPDTGNYRLIVGNEIRVYITDRVSKI